ncbi:hypothetical protein [Mycobacterium leprae]|nr:hypothetical protein [Mycobacterium leprae]
MSSSCITSTVCGIGGSITIHLPENGSEVFAGVHTDGDVAAIATDHPPSD